MSNSDTKEIAVSYSIGDNEIKLTPKIVQEYIVGGSAQITMQEFKLFTELCKVQKLNPFLKEAYCIKYGNQPATIVVGKDVVIKRAVLHPMYDGKESGVIVSANETITERNGCFVAPGETLIGGWARVYRKDRTHPEYMSVSLSEVQGKKADGSINSTWANKGATMVEKVAKVRALREAFVDELAGLYEATEMDADIPGASEMIDTTATVVEPAETVDLNNI